MSVRRPQSARHFNSTIQDPVAIRNNNNNTEQQQQQQLSLETIEDEVLTDGRESIDGVEQLSETRIEDIAGPMCDPPPRDVTQSSHKHINTQPNQLISDGVSENSEFQQIPFQYEQRTSMEREQSILSSDAPRRTNSMTSEQRHSSSIRQKATPSIKQHATTVNSEISKAAITANIVGKFSGAELEKLDAAKKHDSSRTSTSHKHGKKRLRKTRRANRKSIATAATAATGRQDDSDWVGGPGTPGATGVKSHAASSGFQLVATENSDIKNWLHRKNKQLRKRRAEERKKARQRKLEELEKQKEALAKKEVSAEKVKNWMNEKKMEEKLLRQRVQSTGAEVVLASKVTAIINQTFELQRTQQQDGEKPISVNVTTRDSVSTSESKALMAETHDVAEEIVGRASVTDRKPVRQNQRAPTRHSVRRISQDVEQNGLQQLRLNSSRAAGTGGTTGGGGGGRVASGVVSPRQSLSPTRVSFPSENNGELKLIVQRTDDLQTRQRISYDDWLAKKRAADETRRREIARQQQQKAAASDPIMADIVQSVARRRIEAILEGKKRIDTGLSRKFDDKASEYPKTRVRNLYRLLGDTERRDGRCESEIKSRHDEKSSPESVEVRRCDSALPASPAPGRGGKESERASPLHLWKPALVDMSAGFHPRIDESLGRPASAAAFPRRPASPRRGGSSPVPDTLQRPATAYSYRLQPTPSTGNNDVTSSLQVEKPLSGCRSLTVTRLQAVTPRPNLPPTNAYGHVTYQQKSWEKFADFVWNKVNEAEGGTMVEVKMEARPEPIGADGPGCMADSNQVPALIPTVPAIGLVAGILPDLEPSVNDVNEDFGSCHSDESHRRKLRGGSRGTCPPNNWAGGHCPPPNNKLPKLTKIYQDNDFKVIKQHKSL